jgi:YidC/Oxa1 family membrane protein insertase
MTTPLALSATTFDNAIKTVLGPLITVLDAVVTFFHGIGLGWGLSIIALTVVVRIILLPLTIKQFRSMQALSDLAPQIKDLQAKYKDDKQRLNQEMMKFYSENNVNPFGSCLPLLAQIPVFMALFYMLRVDLKIDICPTIADNSQKFIQNNFCVDKFSPVGGPAKFFFIQDLTAPGGQGFNPTWVLVFLLVLYVGSQLLSSILMATSVDRNQKIITYALPFIFVIFIQSFPTGLLVYWITTNFWTVGQQYWIKRATGQLPTWLGGEPELATAGAAAGGGSAAVKASGKAKGNGKGGSAKATPPPPPRKKKKRSGKRS